MPPEWPGLRRADNKGWREEEGRTPSLTEQGHKLRMAMSVQRSLLIWERNIARPPWVLETRMTPKPALSLLGQGLLPFCLKEVIFKTSFDTYKLPASLLSYFEAMIM